MSRFEVYGELALGADRTATPTAYSWTDVTPYMHLPAKVQITRGRGDRYAQTSWDRCNLTLQNQDGRFTPSNPVGDWYGQLVRGTPLRILVRPNTNNAGDVFNRTASAGWASADVGGPWTNNGGAASDYSVAAATGGRHLHTSANSSHQSTLASVSLIRVDITVRVTINALSTGASQRAGVICRYVDASNSRRGDLVVDTGGGITAALITRDAGVEATVVSQATGLTHSTSTSYWVRLQTGQTSVRMKVWAVGTDQPSTWLLDGADGAVFLFPVAGRIGLFSRREIGNTNANATMDFDDFSMVDGPRIQFTGQVDQWPVRWADMSLSLSLAPVIAYGQLEQVSQGQTLQSLLFNLHTADAAIVAYWPMEDEDASESFASGIGGRPLFFDDMSPHADSSFAGSDALPTAGAGAVYYADVPTYPASTAWGVRIGLKLPASPSVATGLVSWTTGGTAVRWALELAPGTPDVLRLRAYNAAGTELLADAGTNFVGSDGAELTGRQLYLEASATQNGGNIDWSTTVWSTDVVGPGTTGSVAATIGNVGRVYHSAYPGLTAGGYTVGHIAVGSTATVGAGHYGATGAAGEPTTSRMQRLCFEQDVNAFVGDLVLGSGSTTQTMGPQRTLSLIAQLREIEETEAGILYDGKQGQIHLLPRTMRQNRPVDLTLDVGARQVGWPIEPIDDNLLFRNDVTVSRVGGSSARAKDLASIRASGPKPWPVSINSETDTVLQQHANRRLRIGTVDELRYPAVVLDLTRDYLALADDWLDCDIGGRIQIVNLPAGQLPPDTPDLLVEGYTETIDSQEWTVAINTSPARQQNVFTIQGGGNAGRVGTTSTLVAGVGAAAVSLSVATAAGNALWRSGAVSFDVWVAGERMTVTNVAGTTSPQTFTVTRSVNGVVKAQAAAAVVKLWKPGVLAL